MDLWVLHKDTHSEEFLWLRLSELQRQSHLATCVFSRISPSVQTCQFARLVCDIFLARGPWLVSALAVWQNVQTYLSGDTDLYNSVSFRRPSP